MKTMMICPLLLCLIADVSLLSALLLGIPPELVPRRIGPAARDGDAPALETPSIRREAARALPQSSESEHTRIG